MLTLRPIDLQRQEARAPPQIQAHNAPSLGRMFASSNNGRLHPLRSQITLLLPAISYTYVGFEVLPTSSSSRRSERERTRNPTSHSERTSACGRAARDAARSSTNGRVALGGDERPAEGHPPRTRGPGAQRGGNLAPGRARKALAADRVHRLRGHRGRLCGRRSARNCGAGGKQVRAALGGEWTVVSCIVSELCRAPKCRAADDLLLACELHPAYAMAGADLRI
jgi:hypothetical protein